jgi:hypothetical protein
MSDDCQKSSLATNFVDSAAKFFFVLSRARAEIRKINDREGSHGATLAPGSATNLGGVASLAKQPLMGRFSHNSFFRCRCCCYENRVQRADVSGIMQLSAQV